MQEFIEIKQEKEVFRDSEGRPQISEQSDDNEEILKLERISQMKSLERRRFIKDKYKLQIPPGSKEMPRELVEQMEKELAEIEEAGTINGVDYTYCQFWKIAEEYNKKDKDGNPNRVISIEAFSPYLKDYLDYMATENTDQKVDLVLKKEDEIGIRILLKLIEKMPEAHIVSLYDEYNIWMSASNVLGQPLNPDKYKPREKMKERVIEFDYDRSEVVAPPALRENFKNLLIKILSERKVIKQTEDVVPVGPQEHLNLISESEKIDDAKRLVAILNDQGLIEGDIHSEKGEIWFQNTIDHCEDPRYMRILLRDKDGHWQCPALDASSYLDNDQETRSEKYRNRNIIHLTVLPDGKQKDKDGRLIYRSFRDERNQVWEILRSIKNHNYESVYTLLQVHDVFFDPSKSVEEIIRGIESEIEKYEFIP